MTVPGERPDESPFIDPAVNDGLHHVVDTGVHDPVGTIPRPSGNDVRQAISDTDGDRAVAEHDIGRILDRAGDIGSRVVRAVSIEDDRTGKHRERRHGDPQQDKKTA